MQEQRKKSKKETRRASGERIRASSVYLLRAIRSAKKFGAQEDDWLAWKSARSMLADWQKTYKDLDHKTSEVT